ncbi:hypothetical protein ACU8KH_05635 [Lachancea thermotolerans]
MSIRHLLAFIDANIRGKVYRVSSGFTESLSVKTGFLGMMDLSVSLSRLSLTSTKT